MKDQIEQKIKEIVNNSMASLNFTEYQQKWVDEEIKRAEDRGKQLRSEEVMRKLPEYNRFGNDRDNQWEMGFNEFRKRVMELLSTTNIN